jgi:hypothetical protein
LLDNAVGRCQPESYPLASGFGAEEWFKQPGLRLGVHPDARVLNRENDIGTGGELGAALWLLLTNRKFADSNRNLAAVRHRVARIQSQIHYDLF